MISAAALSFAVLPAASAQLTAQREFEASLPDSVKYAVPQFGAGRIVYKNGEFSNGTMNICIIDHTLRFLDETGTEKVLSSEDDIARVNLGGTMFIRHNKSYLQVCDQIDGVMLCYSKRYVPVTSKKGAFGMASETTNIKEVGRMGDSGEYVLKAGDEFKVQTTPFFCRDSKVVGCTEKALTKMLPDRKAAIQEYSDANKVSYSSLEDLQKLFEALGN